jgi:hypothetical protein
MIAQTVMAAEEVNHALSYGIGATALLILVGLMVGLVAFGGGREHS